MLFRYDKKYRRIKQCSKINTKVMTYGVFKNGKCMGVYKIKANAEKAATRLWAFSSNLTDIIEVLERE